MVVRISCVQRSVPGIDLGRHVHRRFRAKIGQHPLDITRGGQPSRAPRQIAHFQRGKLDRRIECHENRQLRANAILHVFENAVAESVPTHVGRGPTAVR